MILSTACLIIGFAFILMGVAMMGLDVLRKYSVGIHMTRVSTLEKTSLTYLYIGYGATVVGLLLLFFVGI
jgi:hypothetical protein